MNCRGPINRLVMLKKKGIGGPFYQRVAPGVCVAAPGSYYDVGGPGAGPRAIYGVVLSETSVEVRFTSCVAIGAVTGIELQIDGGAWEQVTGQAGSGTVYTFTPATAIQAGDVVRWRYTGGSGSILDCEDSEDIGDQEIPVENPLVLAGDFVLLETGGSQVVLVEEDVDETNAVELEEAP